MRGDGRGGPNQEYALAAALAAAGEKNIAGLAGDTDGIDGQGEAAGAFFDGRTAKARRRAEAALQANDTGGFFERGGGLFVTGPTGTNVNDLRIILAARRNGR